MAMDATDTVDVLHPSGQIITMPVTVAQQVGVTPDMIVPRNQPQQVTTGEYGLNASAINSIPSPGPAPQPQPPAPSSPPSAPPTTSTMGPKGRNNLGVYGGTGVDQEIASPSGIVTPAEDNTNPTPLAPSSGVQPASAAPVASQGPASAAPMSTAGLRKEGIAGIYNASSEALKGVEDAARKTAELQANQQLAVADAKEQANKRIDDLLKQRAADAEAKQNEIQNRITDYDTAVKKYADTKIDRTVDHPILAAISVALSGLGSAMRNEGTNPGIDALYKAIDRKVAGQMADKAALGEKIGMAKTTVDMARQNASDSTARYNLNLAGEIEKTARQIDAMGTRSSVDTVRAQAAEVAAQLRQKGADALGSAVMAQQGTDERDRAFKEQQRASKASEGVAYGHLALARKGLDEQIREHDLARQDKLDELALGYAKLGAKDKAERAKEVATSGVFDPTSGQAVLTPDGQKIIDQADKLEVAARKAPPEQQAQMLAQAKNLRDQAEAVGGFTIGDKDIRKDVIKKVGASQDMINTIDDIKATLATDPSSIDRTTWAALETKYEQAKAAFIEAHGAKMSSREMEAVHDMFGASPGDVSTRVGGRAKMLARLDALEQGAIGGTTTELHANGYKGQWTPRHVGGDAPAVLGGATSVERSADAAKGAIGSVLPDSDLKFRDNKTRELQAENSGPITPTGLSAQDTAVVQQLATRYENATNAERGKIKSQLQSYSASTRPGQAQAVATLVNAENPGLYKEIAAGGGARVAGDGTPLQATTDRIAQQQVLQSTPIDNLREAALAGDLASKSELARRALDPKNSEAHKALADVILGTR